MITISWLICWIMSDYNHNNHHSAPVCWICWFQEPGAVAASGCTSSATSARHLRSHLPGKELPYRQRLGKTLRKCWWFLAETMVCWWFSDDLMKAQWGFEDCFMTASWSAHDGFIVSTWWLNEQWNFTALQMHHDILWHFPDGLRTIQRLVLLVAQSNMSQACTRHNQVTR